MLSRLFLTQVKDQGIGGQMRGHSKPYFPESQLIPKILKWNTYERNDRLGDLLVYECIEHPFNRVMNILFMSSKFKPYKCSIGFAFNT